jgi:hypothetical protein
MAVYTPEVARPPRCPRIEVFVEVVGLFGIFRVARHNVRRHLYTLYRYLLNIHIVLDMLACGHDRLGLSMLCVF